MNRLYVRISRDIRISSVPHFVQSKGLQLKWCQYYVNWNVSDYHIVVFTDELRFALQTDDKRVRVWKEEDKRNWPQNIIKHCGFWGESIIVWAGISLEYRSDHYIFRWCSVIAVRYRYEVLNSNKRLYIPAVDPAFFLMGDDARPHVIMTVDDYLENEGIARMAWSTYSPELNQTENLWETFGQAAACKRFPPKPFSQSCNSAGGIAITWLRSGCFP